MAAKRKSTRAAKRKSTSRGATATARRRAAVHRPARKSAAGKWSARVMQKSDAMDLEAGVFKKRSARQVALSLKRSAERSHRRKSMPFRSAMSMLNFEINRGGRSLSAERRRVLENAKAELRKAFGRASPSH